MTWQGISTGRRVLRSPNPETWGRLLPRGTLIVELPAPGADVGAAVLIDLERDVAWPNRFRLRLSGPGAVLIEHLQGHAATHAMVRFPVPEPNAALRITVSWHAPERIGLITVEDLSRGTTTLKVFEEPRPWSFGDVAALVEGGATLHPDVTAVAVSDRVEPTGLTGGFAAGTRVDTADGPQRVETLRPGDLVQTSAHGEQPIRQIASYVAPNVGHFTPVRLTAPFFGLQRDLVVAQDHRLLVTGADAEYLFGAEEVLIEAHYLRRIAEPVSKLRPPTIQYVHVLLDAHVCLSVGGGWGESLYVGDLGAHPAQHATSILADLPVRALPRHAEIASPELRGYEAAVLVSALCA